MSLQVVVGAGATGAATARQLADSGERVRLITRSGSGPDHPGIERVAADAADAERLAALTQGAATLFNCAMPAYNLWPTGWPPLAAALLTAAERTGADYVMLGNVYGYGPVDGPFTEEMPMAPTTVKGRVRAKMWLDALDAHHAGRVRVTEVRASDFFGPSAASLYTLTVVPGILAGSPARYAGDPDVPHSWTYPGDAARALIAASRDDRAWGRGWHVPSTSEASVAELSAKLAEAAGAPTAEVTRLSDEEFDAFARADAIMAEIREMRYLFDRPAILDSAETERILGLKATPLDDVVRELIDDSAK
ncbi:NAD-dependent epimerase/dehydratase family protein [Amycolatopsis cynarae]|uniref:NAD-dependent epimerase/dehydratase family protein n=1 Tax=Amycolatopsis cynarae TaxID=2995223 RepID=A0ABY7B104_9PSEU|nr:NAD-dependent epimerase/dehydratase family protein [Amycolatopsis sp. HUAS 11-8]WAL65981.1 NAD-dependent epimerase/dehydratase family protein [Amycolatopsis sp. HUAS 11-8]